MKRLTDEIKTNTAAIRQLMAQQSAGQISYDQTVIPSDFSHKHMPSALESGNLAAAINFTTRPTYNGADVIVDGDPVGLQADDDATRLGVDADTAVTTGTKVLHVSLVDQSGNAMEAQDLASRAGFQKITDGTNIARMESDDGNIPFDTGIDLMILGKTYAFDAATPRWLRTELIAAGGDNISNSYNQFITASMKYGFDGTDWQRVTLTDGTYNPLHVRQTDGEELVTTGKYAVTMEIENIAASQDFILIDKSDTTNFPHTSATGIVHITILDMEIDPDSSFVGDIELGFLENVDGDNGDFHVIKEWHMDKRAAIIEDFVSLIGDPFKCSSTYHLTNEISLNDAAFQTDVALSSPYDDTAAYSTVSGDGDIALRITMSAGSADLSIEIKYYVV